MKNLTLKSKITCILIALFFFASCSNDDDIAPVSEPSFSYTETSLDAIFFQAGNSAAPNIEWNGDQGTFSLANNLTGLEIDSTTGILSWSNELPIGTHNVQVIATNSAGQTSVSITIENPLQGTFTGDYDNTTFFEIEFRTDGTCTLGANDANNPDLAEGTWTITGNTVAVDYTYNVLGDEYSLLGTITTGTNAVYEGDWYREHGTIGGNVRGVFSMTLN